VFEILTERLRPAAVWFKGELTTLRVYALLRREWADS
jgi:hypothetical protein